MCRHRERGEGRHSTAQKQTVHHGEPNTSTGESRLLAARSSSSRFCSSSTSCKSPRVLRELLAGSVLAPAWRTGWKEAPGGATAAMWRDTVVRWGRTKGRGGSWGQKWGSSREAPGQSRPAQGPRDAGGPQASAGGASPLPSPPLLPSPAKSPGESASHTGPGSWGESWGPPKGAETR